jgi:hypothetical protein
METPANKKRWADVDDDEPFSIEDFPNIEFVKTDKNGIRVPYVPPQFRAPKPDKKTSPKVSK